MSFANRYGALDRLLHRLAFATPTAQIGVADVEERLYRKELEALGEVGAPVLITALPRAGTTVLLEIVAALPEFAAHTYRDMPFVLCPMLWRSLAGGFGKKDRARERAHADGLLVSLDSPEAFEEMVWRAFHKRHYREDRIVPWAACADTEFVEFYAGHRRKIVALRARDETRRGDGARPRRYVSKNNVNIARLPAVLDAVPDATMVVAVREPLQHAASLLRQHLRFTELHEEDAFARRYMAGSGHYDFGLNLRPIDFGDWLDAAASRDPRDLAFWLDYWLAAYRHVLDHVDRERVHVVAFEALGAATDLAPLAAVIATEPAGLDAQRERLRAASLHAVDTAALDGDRVAAARDVYAQLAERSVLPVRND